MKILSSFLEKFKNIIDPQQERIYISNIISSLVGDEINESVISIKNGIIFLQISPMLKTQIFLNKQKIIEILNKQRPNLHIVDIR